MGTIRKRKSSGNIIFSSIQNPHASDHVDEEENKRVKGVKELPALQLLFDIS